MQPELNSLQTCTFTIAWRGDVAGLYILEEQEQAQILFANHKAAAKAVCGWEGAAFDDCILSALIVAVWGSDMVRLWWPLNWKHTSQNERSKCIMLCFRFHEIASHTETDTKRAPGPGPIKKIQWRPLAKRHLENRKIIFHTDSAWSYKLKLKDVCHDHVVHQKKRVKVRGRRIWRLPTYVKTVEHTLPASSEGRNPSDRPVLAIHQRSYCHQSKFQGRQRCFEGAAAICTMVLLAPEWWFMAPGVLCTWITSAFLL